MKKLLTLSIVLFACIAKGKAQDSAAQMQANTIAQRMRDTLSLSDEQRSQIATATASIQAHRITLKAQFTGSKGLVYYLKTEEDKRDSLYQSILPSDKYLLYLQKRLSLTNVD